MASNRDKTKGETKPAKSAGADSFTGPSRMLFFPGIIRITRGALAELNMDDVTVALNRHLLCDWGDVCEEDGKENDFAIDKHLRLLSAYHDRNAKKFWLITEADRSATTILLPSEY